METALKRHSARQVPPKARHLACSSNDREAVPTFGADGLQRGCLQPVIIGDVGEDRAYFLDPLIRAVRIGDGAVTHDIVDDDDAARMGQREGISTDPAIS